MFFKKTALVVAAVGLATAQRPSNTSICDYYTTAALKNNTAANQMTLLTLVVNTAVIGNYSSAANTSFKVPGILAAGEYNGTSVNLLPYFDGGLASTNGGGSSGISQNFLDDGGAVPLMMNKPANGTTSNQYMLLTHLYEYFGVLLGCTMQGNDAYPAYAGDNSMYEVHKFMDLSAAEFGYFVSQVALAAESFGVASSDLTIVGSALNAAFGYNDAQPAVVAPNQPAALQAICIGDGCPVAANSTTAGYTSVGEPSTAVSSLVPTSAPATGSTTPAATATAAGGGATSKGAGTGSATSAATAASTSKAGAAEQAVIGLGAVAAGFAALLL